MISAEFLARVAPLFEAFGEKRFPEIVLERIQARTRDLSDDELQTVLEMAVDNCQTPPTVARLSEFANIVRGRREAPLEQSRPIQLLCHLCNDLGVLEALPHDETQAPTLLRCRCREGLDHWANIPVFGNRANVLYVVHACPIEWFKPARSAEGRIEYGAIERRIHEWRARIQAAEAFWRAEKAKAGRLA